MLYEPNPSKRFHLLNLIQNLIDGAAFIGVGFDGRGEYSPESRKMSIVQRTCAGKVKYVDEDSV